MISKRFKRKTLKNKYRKRKTQQKRIPKLPHEEVYKHPTLIEHTKGNIERLKSLTDEQKRAELQSYIDRVGIIPLKELIWLYNTCKITFDCEMFRSYFGYQSDDYFSTTNEIGASYQTAKKYILATNIPCKIYALFVLSVLHDDDEIMYINPSLILWFTDRFPPYTKKNVCDIGKGAAPFLGVYMNKMLTRTIDHDFDQCIDSCLHMMKHNKLLIWGREQFMSCEDFTVPLINGTSYCFIHPRFFAVFYRHDLPKYKKFCDSFIKEMSRQGEFGLFLNLLSSTELQNKDVYYPHELVKLNLNPESKRFYQKIPGFKIYASGQIDRTLFPKFHS